MSDVFKALTVLGCGIGFWVGLYLLKWMGIGLFRLIEKLCQPLERRLLLALQDRAAARTLGIDVDDIRARRKIDFG